MKQTLLLTCLFLIAGGLHAQCENVNPDCTVLSDFECQTNYVGLPSVTNPAPDAVNGSTLVGEYPDLDDAYDALIIDFGGPLDLSAYNQLNLKVYTTAAPTGRLLAILEGGTSPRLELAIDAITNGAWTEYSFDFSSQATENHTQLVLIFNADISRTNGPELYYLDDMRWTISSGATDPCSGVSVHPNIINDFECQQNEPFQACFPVIANPVPDADNSSAFVGCFKDVGAEFDNIYIQYDGAIDLSTNNQFSMMVNTDIAGNLLVKLEGGSSPPVEVPFALAGDGSWEMVNIDFSGQAGANHTRLVLFFNAGVIPGADDKYFIDNLIWDAALPVTLSGFSARSEKGNVLLTWETAVEIGADKFIIEHQSDQANNWSPIGTVNAAGESTQPQTYHFTHRSAGRGDHLYRLRMVDLDGSMAYSPIRMVTMDPEATEFSVHPNPFADRLTIKVASDAPERARIALLDISGRTVLVKEIDLEAGINNLLFTLPSGLRKGTYLLKMTHNRQVQSAMMVH